MPRVALEEAAATGWIITCDSSRVTEAIPPVERATRGYRSATLSRSPLVGSDLRLWHRLSTDDGQTRSYHRMLLPEDFVLRCSVKWLHRFLVTRPLKETNPLYFDIELR